MAATHLVIDTSILRDDPRRNQAGFQAIVRLAAAGLVTVHIPYVVRKEFTSHQQMELKKSLKGAVKALEALCALPLDTAFTTQVQQIINKTSALKPRVPGHAEMEFDGWINQIGANVHPIEVDHGLTVMEDYFDGNPPFKGVKTRNDIPDSFIWQSVLSIRMAHGSLSFVTRDNTLFEACESQSGITGYGSLDDFLASSTGQSLIKTELTQRFIQTVRSSLKQNEWRLKSLGEDALTRSLESRTVESDDIPEDHGTASISSVEAIHDVSTRIDEIQYFGSGLFVIPFRAEIECSLEYLIHKADYHGLDDERIEAIAITDWNGQYFMAEETRTLAVEGQLAINLGVKAEQEAVNEQIVLKLLGHQSIGVDAIEAIETLR